VKRILFEVGVKRSFSKGANPRARAHPPQSPATFRSGQCPHGPNAPPPAHGPSTATAPPVAASTDMHDRPARDASGGRGTAERGDIIYRGIGAWPLGACPSLQRWLGGGRPPQRKGTRGGTALTQPPNLTARRVFAIRTETAQEYALSARPRRVGDRVESGPRLCAALPERGTAFCGGGMRTVFLGALLHSAGPRLPSCVQATSNQRI